jgi:hypothetical protein
MLSCDLYLSFIIVLLLLIIFVPTCINEDFNGGPSVSERKKLVEDALKNKHVFHPQNGSFTLAKRAIPEIDNVTYEDFRGLYFKDRFTREGLESTFGA